MRAARLLLVAGLVVLTSLTGCAPIGQPGSGVPYDGPGPDHDFWGNPVEDDDAVADGMQPSCAVESGPAAREYAPATDGRPSKVRPGYSWIVFEYEVRALPPQGDAGPEANDYCVPVAVHVYVRPGEADVVAEGVNAFEAGPFDFRVITPWLGRYIVLQYDPTEERFQGRPPSFEITMEATYLGERDKFAETRGAPLALGCKLKIGGAGVASDTAFVGTKPFVKCTFKGNTFLPY